MWNDYEDYEDEDTQQTTKYRRRTFSESDQEEDDF
jgi:hypothetical protein